MITNSDITILNRVYDPIERLDKWNKTSIKNVSFYSEEKVNLDGNGLKTANVYKIRIPEESLSGYVCAGEYTGEENTWTIQIDDYIVKGELEQEITRPAELKEKIRIHSFSDNRRGLSPHLRIGGNNGN